MREQISLKRPLAGVFNSPHQNASARAPSTQGRSPLMKEIPDLKEIVTICTMNFGLATWYLTSIPCSSFEELLRKVFTYEESSHANFIRKATQFASADAVADAYVASDHNS